MGFRFRRSLKILPGIRLNVTGHSGLSSLTVGSGHAHLNVPLGRSGPAIVSAGNFGGLLTGLSYRQNAGMHHCNSESLDVDEAKAALKADQDQRMAELLASQEKRRRAL
jgi:hypothetical protein